MDINRENLDTVFRGLRNEFRNGLQSGENKSADQIATTIKSTTASERFDWLGDEPQMREWVAARQIHQLASYSYEVYPKSWEVTLKAKRDDLEDDRIGLYSLQARSGGHAAGLLKVREVCRALDNGDTGLCFDGQPMFDTEHPVGEDGDISLVSNLLNSGGASTASPWYIADLSRVIKPIIVVDRKQPEFQAFDDMNNLHTFNNREFLYGADARLGTGYGFWQSIVRNEAALCVDNLMATRFAMSQYTQHKKNPYGQREKLGIRGNTLIVGQANEEKALACLKSATVASRSDALALSANNTPNPCFGLFNLIVLSWLP